MPTTNQYYNETAAIATYQDTTNNIVQEKFIFHVDFRETTITQTSTGNTLVMELRKYYFILYYFVFYMLVVMKYINCF